MFLSFLETSFSIFRYLCSNDILLNKLLFLSNYFSNWNVFNMERTLDLHRFKKISSRCPVQDAQLHNNQSFISASIPVGDHEAAFVIVLFGAAVFKPAASLPQRSAALGTCEHSDITQTQNETRQWNCRGWIVSSPSRPDAGAHRSWCEKVTKLGILTANFWFKGPIPRKMHFTNIF